MLRLIHAADFHLDSAFAALSAQEARGRRRESRELVRRLCQYTNDAQAQLLLLAGDLFDSDGSYRETGEELLAALADVRAEVFIAPGNHDFYAAGSPYETLDFPKNVHIFKSKAIEKIALPELGVAVYGAAFTAPEQRESLLAGFHAEDDGLLPLMVLHGDLSGGEARYNPLTREEIAASGLSYLALGHTHRHEGKMVCGKTVCAYSGCLEGRGFDELGERGFLEGCMDETGVSLQFVPLARHRYEICKADVTDKTALEAANAALPSGTENDLYRVIFTGESDELSLAELQNALEGRFYKLELRDETRLRRDVWARAREDSLGGLFLRELLASGAEEELRNRAARFGLAALEHRDLI